MINRLVFFVSGMLFFISLVQAQSFSCGTSTVTFTYSGASVTYGTVTNPTTGRCWLDRNLGASQVATSSTDALAYGDLFQWGRGADGHQLRASTTTTTTSSTANPGHGEFIIGSGDWLSPPNDNLWQGVNGTNNPCPSGWRIPTLEELEAEMNSWSSQSNIGAFASPLKLPMAGERYFANGSLNPFGPRSAYWTSTPSTSFAENARVLLFDASSSQMTHFTQAYGLSVRCIYDCPTAAGTLSGNQTICIGASSSFSSTVSGGIWSSANTAIATVDASSGVVAGVSGGTTTITYTIAGTGSCPNVTTTRVITVLAASSFNTNSITQCPNSTYLVALTTGSPATNGWSCTGAGLSVNDGYLTAGSSAGTGTVSYTDGCGVTVSATVNVTMIPGARSIELDRLGAHRFDGNPQGPAFAGFTINYVGYGGFNYVSQSRPTDAGYYRANIQSGSAAGCPCEYYIFRCTSCGPTANSPAYSAQAIQIGSQKWMAENLNVSTYRDGTPIPEVTDNTAWSNSSSGAWSWHGNNAANGSTYGRLYNWFAVNDPRGLCPEGWHVPSRAEWETLAVTLGGTIPSGPNGDIASVGAKMKTVGTSLWGWSNTNATNESGFSGLPGGYRMSNGVFTGPGQGWWWSSSNPSPSTAYGVYLVDSFSSLSFNIYYSDKSGFSVRCIKD